MVPSDKAVATSYRLSIVTNAMCLMCSNLATILNRML